LRCRTVPEKLPKIPLFGTSLIHQLRLLGSQQHPQSRELSTPFSTWGTENSLANINLESMIEGCNIFGIKIGKNLQLCGRVQLSCSKKKSREKNVAGRTR